MDIISEKIVEETRKEIGGISLEDAPKLGQRFQKVQPFLAGYLYFMTLGILKSMAAALSR